MKVDPKLQALIDALVSSDASRVSAVSKTTTKNPRITFSGIPDNSPYANTSSATKGKSHPSAFHRLLDIIGRPLQAVEVGTKHAQDVKDNSLFQFDKLKALAEGAASGFTGHEHTTGQELLKGTGHSGKGMGTLGFALDVGLDPLTYVGPGAIKAVGKGIKALKGGKAVEETAAVRTALNATSPIGKSVSIASGVAKERMPAVATTKSFGKAATRPVEVVAPVSKKFHNTIEAKRLGLVPESQLRQPKLPPMEAVIKSAPKPKPVKFEELPDTFQADAHKTAQMKAAQQWTDTPLAQKLGRGNGPIPWEKAIANPAIKASPEFRNWYTPILKAEKDAAVAETDARNLASFHSMIKALDKAAPVESAADVVIHAAKDLPKVLKPEHVKIAEAATIQHHLIHGLDSLTPEGMAKLRQTVSNQYFKSRPIRIKGLPKTVSTLNEIYKRAEQNLFDMGTLSNIDNTVPRLSQIIDQLPADVVSDPSKMIKAIRGASVKDMAVQAASELPKQAQKNYVSGLLDALKNSGNATEVVQTRSIPAHEIRFRAAEAVAKDMGDTSIPKMPLPERQLNKTKTAEQAISDSQAAKVAGFVGKAKDALDRAFNAAYNQTAWEHSAAKMGENAVNTYKEHDINILRSLIKGTDKKGFNAAYDGARLGQPGARAEQVQGYFDHLKQMMENAGVSEQEFLTKLKRVPMLQGKKVDVSLGFDVWKSIPATDSHAVKLMAYYADAAHNATLDSEVAGQLGNLFGAVKATNEAEFNAAKAAGYTTVNDTPSLQGIIFHPDDAKRIQQILDEIGPKGKRAEGFFKVYDRLQGLYKTGLTKYLPSHHITNDIGQKYMAWLDGVTNPAWYTRAIKVMAHQGAADNAATTMGRVSLKLRNGTVLTEPEIMSAFEGAGLRPSFAGIADLAGEEPQFKGAIPAAVDKFSQAREVHNRLAHFMYAVSTEKGTLDDVIHKAAMRVQKHHADYGDLTEFERKVMRRVIPFYSWQRKVAPTLLRQAWMNPGKIMVYPKAQMAINQHFGIQPDANNPFPGLSMIPSFMMEGDQAIYGKHNGNPIFGAFRTPFDDIVGKEANHPVGNILDMLGPAFKIPHELISGTAIGNPNIHVLTKSQDRATYLENQTPMLSVLMRLTRRDPLHGFTPTKQAPDEQGFNWVALLNLLTAGGVKEDTQRYQDIAAKEQKKP